jgi:hypothetical protein
MTTTISTTQAPPVLNDNHKDKNSFSLANGYIFHESHAVASVGYGLWNRDKNPISINIVRQILNCDDSERITTIGSQIEKYGFILSTRGNKHRVHTEHLAQNVDFLQLRPTSMAFEPVDPYDIGITRINLADFEVDLQDIIHMLEVQYGNYTKDSNELITKQTLIAHGRVIDSVTRRKPTFAYLCGAGGVGTEPNRVIPEYKLGDNLELARFCPRLDGVSAMSRDLVTIVVQRVTQGGIREVNYITM